MKRVLFVFTFLYGGASFAFSCTGSWKNAPLTMRVMQNGKPDVLEFRQGSAIIKCNLAFQWASSKLGAVTSTQTYHYGLKSCTPAANLPMRKDLTLSVDILKKSQITHLSWVSNEQPLKCDLVQYDVRNMDQRINKSVDQQETKPHRDN